jgi:broad specificity phosphatase PhoE
VSVPHFPRLYFIRHGETDWNRAGRLQGQMDIPINALGRMQGERNGYALAAAVPGLASYDFVSSPLLRTRQTMEIVRSTAGLTASQYSTDDRLREISFGAWEGKTWEELTLHEGDAMKARKADRFNFVVPGGESYAMVSSRLIDWLNSLTRPAVVVAHGGIMRCLRGYAISAGPAAIPKMETPQDRVMVVDPGVIGWL